METPDVMTDAERFAEYRANPTVEKRNKLVEFYQHDCRRLANSIFRKIRGNKYSIQREEYVLDCYIVLIKSIEKYSPERGLPFTAFLLFNLRRKLFNVSERETKRSNGKLAYSLENGELTTDPVDYRANGYEQIEGRDLLKFAADVLGENFVQQRFIDGLTIEEVADNLKVNKSKVQARIHSFARLYKKRSKIDVT